MQGTLASALEASIGGRTEEEYASFMQRLRSAGRMTVSSDIVERVDDVKWRAQTRSEMSKEIFDTVRLSFENTWIEWAPTQSWRDKAPPGPSIDRMGYLFARSDEGLEMNLVSHGNAGLILLPVTITATPDGFMARWDRSLAVRNVGEEVVVGCEETLVQGIDVGSRMLIILTAKNAPLRIGPCENYERLNRQRAKLGRPPLLGTRPVKWDLSRFDRPAGHGLSPQERSEAVAHLCRGHLKRRSSGVYWWSPHFRGLRGSPAPVTGRDHVVTDRMAAVH
jgi:hypothetical protein